MRRDQLVSGELRGSAAIHHDHERCDAELLGVLASKRVDDGRQYVGRRPDRLGQNDIWSRYLDQGTRALDELGEGGAEAAHDLSDIETGSPGILGVHQRMALIVGDDGHVLPDRLEPLGKCHREGGLSCA
jgi:hypothetical protein